MLQKIYLVSIMARKGTTGVHTHMETFFRYLIKKNVDSAWVTTFDSPRWLLYPVVAVRKMLELFSGELNVWWYRTFYGILLERLLRIEMGDGKPCVLYVQCPVSALAALKARLNPKQRVILCVHFNVSQSDEWVERKTIKFKGWVYRWIERMERKVLRDVDGLVFVSDFMCRTLLERIPELTNIPRRTIPNFIDDPGISNQRKESRDMITIGTLEPRKNQGYLVEIVAEMKNIGGSMGLNVIGDGPDYFLLIEKAKSLGVNDLIRFMGFVPEASNLIEGHRCYVHSAKMESFGIVLLEAMARGVLVFAPPVGGIPEVIEAGKGAIFIPLENPQKAARIIMESTSEPFVLEEMGLLGRELFLERFETSVVAPLLLSFLTTANLQVGGDDI